MTLETLSTIYPEAGLALALMVVLLLGLFAPARVAFARSMVAALLVLVVLVGMYAAQVVGLSATPTFSMVLLEGFFINDWLTQATKMLVLIWVAVSLILARPYLQRLQAASFEFPVLVLLAALGMVLLVSANDFISFYLAIELQALALYVLAALQRDTVRSTEAGLKYFVLGALSSGLILYGASLLYGLTGSTNFIAIAAALKSLSLEGSLAIPLALVLVLCGFAFKLAAAPFHMWSPDVYEGAPKPITAFFASAPKVVAVVVLARLLFEPFVWHAAIWQPLLLALAVASLLVGALAGLVQQNIKRLLAYSAIGHIGFILLALAMGDAVGAQAALLYTLVYGAMTLGSFAVILGMWQRGAVVEGINDLAGLSKTQPLLALLLAVQMFAMAGIPPTLGFFVKFQVLVHVLHSGWVWLAVLAVACSAVAAYYYLKVIKVLYFDAVLDLALDPQTDRATKIVAALLALFVIAGFLLLPWLNDIMALASTALVVG